MSTLKADTIQNTSGGAATLTKQEATQHYVNYDAANATTDSSLNQSSLNDLRTGEFRSSFTNNFSGATDKVHHASVTNTANDGSTYTSGASRAGSNANMGSLTGNSEHDAPSTSSVQFYTAYNAYSSGNGALYDYSESYCSSIGDLA